LLYFVNTRFIYHLKTNVIILFIKDSFNKAEFIKFMSEKRDNMIKSKVEWKEQFKFLIDLEFRKINKRIK